MNRCFKEWNAVIEAIGQGKQNIMIRKNSTLIPEFLLYPTVSYVLKDDYLEMFQKKHQDFVKNNSLPELKSGSLPVKYFVKIREIEKLSPKLINSIENESIYTKEHVKSYLKNSKGYVWYLDVFKLPEVYWGKTKKQAITFAKLDIDIPSDNLIKI